MYGSSIFVLRNRGNPGDTAEEKEGKNGWKKSSISSIEKFSTSSFPYFRSCNSLTRTTFHHSSSLSGWYLMAGTSLMFTSSTLAFSEQSIIFLRLCPVVDLTSNLTSWRSCLGTILLQSDLQSLKIFSLEDYLHVGNLTRVQLVSYGRSQEDPSLT